VNRFVCQMNASHANSPSSTRDQLLSRGGDAQAVRMAIVVA